MQRSLLHRRVAHPPAYQTLLWIGASSGIVAATWAAPSRGLPPRRVEVALLLLLPVALAGARLLAVAVGWRTYARDPRRIWRRSEGGAALYGGLVLAFLLSFPLLRLLGLAFWAFWDVATLALLVGMVFARTGCLLQGCCSGRPSRSRLALRLPDAEGVWTRRVPTQLLEAGLALALLCAAVSLRRRPPFDGAVFLPALAAYGTARWALEPYRASPDLVRRIRVHRALSAALAAAAAATCLALASSASARAAVGRGAASSPVAIGGR